MKSSTCSDTNANTKPDIDKVGMLSEKFLNVLYVSENLGHTSHVFHYFVGSISFYESFPYTKETKCFELHVSQTWRLFAWWKGFVTWTICGDTM